jgi:hypothetical protein
MDFYHEQGPGCETALGGILRYGLMVSNDVALESFKIVM